VSNWVHKYKPAASRRTHVLAAATLWTLVGAGLLTTGLTWNRSSPGPWLVALLVAAVGVGLLKAHLALRKTAGRMVDRICARGDGRCLGGFLSWRMWLVAVAMMFFGRLIRSGPLPDVLVAFIYQAVGVALLAGAVSLWRAYARLPRPA